MKRNTLISILISFFKTGILLRNEKIWVFTTKRLIDSCKKFLFVISLISELTSFVVIVENYEKSFEINSQCQILQRVPSLSATSGTSASFSCTPWTAKSAPQYTAFGTGGTTQRATASRARRPAEGAPAVHDTLSFWTRQ